MKELPPHYGQPKEQKPIIAKLDTKFVQALGKYGQRLDTETSKAYIFPLVVIKHSESPVGVYHVLRLDELPSEVLSSFGLQKIPANEKL